ncbi:tRNA1(Val) (adenine(37)-N6)-methyltransferase [Petrotoga sp. 9PWA.NaAc.5.4]|uniref:tRNA1(Val) (adenine(37)-N6)-methyltransferase n=1 Tax=Petrotoga sp. 9PWA.NaAc.5.4 TaxID=1434328 RepID=UPI000CA7978C|nr:methyltransferase domain-containing protein [Petrotoga sp. 9PWA.NaAc.5.4]PNR95756.1 O-methyltransferase [Petrotoga sp. 9PWA.NaAc.5.4]
MNFKDKIGKIDQIYRNLNLRYPNNSHLPTHASVLLIATVPVKPNCSIVELGSGIGHVSLVLAKLYEDIKITGIEIQRELYNFSIFNKESNNIENVEFINIDARDVSRHFHAESFDFLISNPPHYFEGLKSEKKDRREARSAESIEILGDFVYASKFLLKNKALGCFVIHPYVLSDFLFFLEKNNLKPQHIYIAYGNKDKQAQLVSVIFRKNGGRNFVIHAPIFFSDWKRQQGL